jgi:hypothetical protein
MRLAIFRKPTSTLAVNGCVLVVGAEISDAPYKKMAPEVGLEARYAFFRVNCSRASEVIKRTKIYMPLTNA